MLQTLTPLEETRAYQNIFAKGIARGKAEGKVEGKAEGEVYLLKRQIIKRFGKLPKLAEKHIDQASSTQLEVWAEAIFDAKTVKELLSDGD